MKKKPKSKAARVEHILGNLDELNERCDRLTILAGLLELGVNAPESELRPEIIGGAGGMMTDELNHVRGGLRRLGEGLL